MAINGKKNGDRIWRWKKVDVLFVVAIGIVIYGAVTHDVAVIVAGTGLFAIPLSHRGDKA